MSFSSCLFRWRLRQLLRPDPPRPEREHDVGAVPHGPRRPQQPPAYRRPQPEVEDGELPEDQIPDAALQPGGPEEASGAVAESDQVRWEMQMNYFAYGNWQITD